MSGDATSFPDAGSSGVWVEYSRPVDRAEEIDFRNMNDVQILAFMGSVLDAVGEQMNARAETLRRRNAEAEQLANEIAVLQRLADLGKAHGDNGNLKVSGGDLKKDKIDGVSVEQWMQEHHPGLWGQINKQDRSSSGQYISGSELNNQIKIRENRQNELSTANEMDMIGFQSLVQSRQMFVNMATQMMNAEHESQNSIARNIG